MEPLLSVGDYLPDVYCPLNKVTRYLMSADPRVDGQGKRAFFVAFGFNRKHPDALVFALELHGTGSPIMEWREDEWGVYWECSGPLRCPDKRAPKVRTIWILRHGERRPTLVTAVPT